MAGFLCVVVEGEHVELHYGEFIGVEEEEEKI